MFIFFNQLYLNIIYPNNLIRSIIMRHGCFATYWGRPKFITNRALEVPNGLLQSFWCLATVRKAHHLTCRWVTGVHMKFIDNGLGSFNTDFFMCWMVFNDLIRWIVQVRCINWLWRFGSKQFFAPVRVGLLKLARLAMQGFGYYPAKLPWINFGPCRN